jgi:hypothetical protein
MNRNFTKNMSINYTTTISNNYTKPIQKTNHDHLKDIEIFQNKRGSKELKVILRAFKYYIYKS